MHTGSTSKNSNEYVLIGKICLIANHHHWKNRANFSRTNYTPMITKLRLLALPVLATLTACNWVELNDTGKKVRVLEASEVTKCEHKGQTTATVTEKVAGMRRHDAAIFEDLVIVARNAANNLGGDTIVPVGEEAGGKLTFKVYRCVPQ